jgi:hypothetical protein
VNVPPSFRGKQSKEIENMDDTDDASAAAEAAAEIRLVIRRELDDCEPAINAGEYDKAKSELEDAVRKLKRITNNLG